MSIPARNPDTMGEAIALSSPNGTMSKQARKAAMRRLEVALFGEAGMAGGHLSTEKMLEEYAVKSALVRQAAIAKAKGGAA